ncbi:MAG: hypothetical protein ACLGIR_06460 [Actinomycetes bacterium]
MRTGRIALLVLIASTLLGVVAGLVAGIDRRPPRTWDLTGTRELAEVGWPDPEQREVEQRDPVVVVFTELGPLDGTEVLVLRTDGERVVEVEVRWEDDDEDRAEARASGLRRRAADVDVPEVEVTRDGTTVEATLRWPGRATGTT